MLIQQEMRQILKMFKAYDYVDIDKIGLNNACWDKDKLVQLPIISKDFN